MTVMNPICARITAEAVPWGGKEPLWTRPGGNRAMNRAIVARFQGLEGTNCRIGPRIGPWEGHEDVREVGS